MLLHVVVAVVGAVEEHSYFGSQLIAGFEFSDGEIVRAGAIVCFSLHVMLLCLVLVCLGLSEGGCSSSAGNNREDS